MQQFPHVIQELASCGWTVTENVSFHSSPASFTVNIAFLIIQIGKKAALKLGQTSPIHTLFANESSYLCTELKLAFISYLWFKLFNKT